MLMCGKVLQLQGQVNHSGKPQRLGVKQVKTWATSTWLKDIIEICIKVPSFLERYYLLNCYIPDQLKRQVLTVLVDDYITMNTDSCEPRICKPTLHGKVLPGPHEHTHKLFWGNWVCFFCKYCDKEEWSECSFSVCVVCFFLFAFLNLHFRVYITFWPSYTLWFAASGGTALCFAYVTLALGVSFAIRSFRDHWRLIQPGLRWLPVLPFFRITLLYIPLILLLIIRGNSVSLSGSVLNLSQSFSICLPLEAKKHVFNTALDF